MATVSCQQQAASEKLQTNTRRDCRYRWDKSVNMSYGARNF